MVDNLVAGIDSAAMAARLKDVIQAAADANMLHSMDWPRHPLPQDLIRSERAGQTSLSMNTGPTVYNGQAANAGQKRKSVEGQATIDTSNVPWRQKGALSLIHI